MLYMTSHLRGVICPIGKKQAVLTLLFSFWFSQTTSLKTKRMDLRIYTKRMCKSGNPVSSKEKKITLKFLNAFFFFLMFVSFILL